MHDHGSDDRLLGRLRQLSLVEVDALLVGASGPAREALLAAHADDLVEALGQARRRMAELGRAIASGPDPLALCDAPPEVRATSAAGPAAERAAGRLVERAEACRDLARLDDACALLLPRLWQLDRRRASGV